MTASLSEALRQSSLQRCNVATYHVCHSTHGRGRNARPRGQIPNLDQAIPTRRTGSASLLPDNVDRLPAVSPAHPRVPVVRNITSGALRQAARSWTSPDTVNTLPLPPQEPPGPRHDSLARRSALQPHTVNSRSWTPFPPSARGGRPTATESCGSCGTTALPGKPGRDGWRHPRDPARNKSPSLSGRRRAKNPAFDLDRSRSGNASFLALQ
jgi:hypothetical protein